MKHEIVKEKGMLFLKTHKEKTALVSFSPYGEPEIVRSPTAPNFKEALYDASQVTEGISPGDEIWMKGELVGKMYGAHLEMV